MYYIKVFLIIFSNQLDKQGPRPHVCKTQEEYFKNGKDTTNSPIVVLKTLKR